VDKESETKPAPVGRVFFIRSKSLLITDEHKPMVYYVPSAFSVEIITDLAGNLEKNSKLWQFCKDTKRGAKDFFITGRWTAPGHFRQFIDRSFPAGVAGNN